MAGQLHLFGVMRQTVMRHIVQEDFAERVRTNQQQLASNLPTRFDYIVCGAGTPVSETAPVLSENVVLILAVLLAAVTVIAF